MAHTRTANKAIVTTTGITELRYGPGFGGPALAPDGLGSLKFDFIEDIRVRALHRHTGAHDLDGKG